jgi:hypothetical protein
MPTLALENAHSTPYWWCRDDDHPYKGPIRHPKPYLETVEKNKMTTYLKHLTILTNG